MTRVLSLERIPAEPPLWLYAIGAIALAIGVAGAMWNAIKLFK